MKGDQTPDKDARIAVNFQGKCGCGKVAKVGHEVTGAKRWVTVHDEPYCETYTRLRATAFLAYLIARGTPDEHA